LATLCIALSLALFSLGGVDPTGGFCLRTLSYSRPTAIMGPILNTVVVSHTIVGTSCEELRRRVNMGLLCLVRARLFASVVIPRGYKRWWPPLCTCRSSRKNSCHLLTSLPTDEKRDIEIGENFRSVENVVSPSLSNYGRIGLNPIRDHTVAPTGPRELGVHDGGGTCNLSCARGPRIPCVGEWIRGVFCDIL
jgi:hypothetical protein